MLPRELPVSFAHKCFHFTQSKGKLRFRDVDGSFIPSEVYQDTLCVGSCNGDYNLNEILLKTQEDTNKYLNDNQQNELREVNYKSDDLKYGKHENVWITSKNSWNIHQNHHKNEKSNKKQKILKEL